jgi:hypothetical protein
MNKKFVVKTLILLKERRNLISQLCKLKINLLEFEEEIMDNLEESIVIILSNGKEVNFEPILSDVSWWLYEKIDKVITVNGNKLDVNEAKAFVDFIENHYD